MSRAHRTIVRKRIDPQPSPTKLRLGRAAVQTAFAVSDELGAGLCERLFTSPRRHARPAREQVALADARAFSIDVELRAPRWRARPRRRLAAWRWGCGPAVLLVHGWEGRGSQLATLVDGLQAVGLSAVAFDAPAHGDSPGERLYLTDFADAIAGALHAIGPTHAVVAHSFGAAAWLLARERARDARGRPPAGWPKRTVAIAPNALVDFVLAQFATTLGLDAVERRVFEARLAASAGLDLDAVQLSALVGRADGDLFVVHDRDDAEIPFGHAERLVSAWPGSELAATTGLGHRRILRDPAVVEQVAEFIAAGIAPPASDLVRALDAELRDTGAR
jgi:hypothetical protein